MVIFYSHHSQHQDYLRNIERLAGRLSNPGFRCVSLVDSVDIPGQNG